MVDVKNCDLFNSGKVQDLLSGYTKFYKSYFLDQPEIYQKLALEGQDPKSLVISCSDSRISPSILFNAEPGSIFSVRNVANLVPPYAKDYHSYHGTSSAIEYAVLTLRVSNIIVLGHSHCGGIRTLVTKKLENNSFIDHWISLAEPAKKRAIAEASNLDEAIILCEKYAIENSLKNIMTFPFVKSRVDAGSLQLYGWHFCLETGLLTQVNFPPNRP